MKRVIAIGTMDGIHRGHAAILKESVSLARRMRMEPLALTFRFPPRHFFSPETRPFLLTVPEEKKKLCGECGVRRVEVLDFTARLARMSAEEFFKRVLVKNFRAGAIVAGYNFGFGRKREGTPAVLKELAKKSGVALRIVPEVKIGRKAISSGRIRKLIAKGEVSNAARLLGHFYMAMGKVVRGDGRGRTLGFPTANIQVVPEKLLPPGVFAARCSVMSRSGKRSEGGIIKHYRAVCNAGSRPTFYKKKGAVSLEVHLLNFKGNLYGRTVKVEFIKRLRAERRFAGPGPLRRQLESDRKQALQALK